MSRNDNMKDPITWGYQAIHRITTRGEQNQYVSKEDYDKALKEKKECENKLSQLDKKYKEQINELERLRKIESEFKETKIKAEQLEAEIKQLETKITERYVPRYRLVEKLLMKVKPLQDDYVETRDEDIEQKEKIEKDLEHLKDKFRFVHYKDDEQYFECINSRKRTHLDKGEDNIIETCPAVFFKDECILKGTYVLLED